MNAYIAGCDALRQGTWGATVVSVHHTGWSDQERGRGSSSQPGALDTEMIVTRDGNRVRLKCRKQKDAEEFAPIELDMVAVAESLVPTMNFNGGVGVLTANEIKALNALQSHFLDDGANAKDWRTAAGLAESSFFHARTSLVKGGYVKHAGSRYRLSDSGQLAVSSRANSNSNPTPTHSNASGPRTPTLQPPLEGLELGVGSGARGRDVEPGSEEERALIAAYEAEHRKTPVKTPIGAERRRT
jgi:hypothetical protein